MVNDLISARRRQTKIGEFLTKAKKLCNHGEWIPFVKTLPFNRIQTQKYLIIGSNALLYLESDDTIDKFYDSHRKKIKKPQPIDHSNDHLTTEDKEPEPKLESKPKPEPKLESKPKPEPKPKIEPTFFDDEDEDKEWLKACNQPTQKDRDDMIKELLSLVSKDDSLMDILNEAHSSIKIAVFKKMKQLLHPDKEHGNEELFKRLLDLENYHE